MDDFDMQVQCEEVFVEDPEELRKLLAEDPEEDCNA